MKHITTAIVKRSDLNGVIKKLGQPTQTYNHVNDDEIYVCYETQTCEASYEVEKSLQEYVISNNVSTR